MKIFAIIQPIFEKLFEENWAYAMVCSIGVIILFLFSTTVILGIGKLLKNMHIIETIPRKGVVIGVVFIACLMIGSTQYYLSLDEAVERQVYEILEDHPEEYNIYINGFKVIKDSFDVSDINFYNYDVVIKGNNIYFKTRNKILIY